MKNTTLILAVLLFCISISYLKREKEINQLEIKQNELQSQLDSLEIEHRRVKEDLKKYVYISFEQQYIMQEKGVKNSEKLSLLMHDLY